MNRIELIEREPHASCFQTAPMDNLASQDFTWLAGQLGCVKEIYLQDAALDQVRRTDQGLIERDTVRILVVTNPLLLATVLMGQRKSRPHLGQLLARLARDDKSHRHEYWIRETEVEITIPEAGPECLFGESLEEALQATSGKCRQVSPEEIESSHQGFLNDLEEPLDLEETSPILLAAENFTHNEEVEKLLEEFFHPIENDGQPLIWLTEEMKA